MKTSILQFSSGPKSDVFSGKASADLFIDCRVIRNPFREESLKGKTGDDTEVQEWLLANAGGTINAFDELVHSGLKSWKTRNSGRNSDVFRVHFFCLAGVHRSRGSKNVIASRFKEILNTNPEEYGFPLTVEVL